MHLFFHVFIFTGVKNNRINNNNNNYKYIYSGMKLSWRSPIGPTQSDLMTSLSYAQYSNTWGTFKLTHTHTTFCYDFWVERHVSWKRCATGFETRFFLFGGCVKNSNPISSNMYKNMFLKYSAKLLQQPKARSAFRSPTKRCKMFIKRKRWCVEYPALMTQELQLWQLRRPFFVLFLKNFLSLMKSV